MSDPDLSGALAPDPAVGGAVTDPSLSGAVITVEPVEVDLPGGQGIAGPPGGQGQPGPAGPGSIVMLTAAADLGGHRVVKLLPNGTIAYASADDLDDVGEVVGITVAAASAGAPVTVSRGEPIVEPSWSFVTGPVFLGLAGALTQALPSLPAAVFRQQVAIALGPTSIVVDLRPPLILA